MHKWGHFRASGIRGSGRFEYKECIGEPKELTQRVLSLIPILNKIFEIL
jgi:hypothetical protein